MQVKHLQDEFEESKGAFISQQTQVSFLLNYVAHRFERVCNLFFFFFLISCVCSIQFARKLLPAVHSLCLSLYFWETTGLYNEGKRHGVVGGGGEELCFLSVLAMATAPIMIMAQPVNTRHPICSHSSMALTHTITPRPWMNVYPVLLDIRLPGCITCDWVSPATRPRSPHGFFSFSSPSKNRTVHTVLHSTDAGLDSKQHTLPVDRGISLWNFPLKLMC